MCQVEAGALGVWGKESVVHLQGRAECSHHCFITGYVYTLILPHTANSAFTSEPGLPSSCLSLCAGADFWRKGEAETVPEPGTPGPALEQRWGAAEHQAAAAAVRAQPHHFHPLGCLQA